MLLKDFIEIITKQLRACRMLKEVTLEIYVIVNEASQGIMVVSNTDKVNEAQAHKITLKF
jgi:hypothetical protein